MNNQTVPIDYDALCERARQRAMARMFPVPNRLGEVAAMDSYTKQIERRRAQARWLWEQDFDYFITLNSNDPYVDYDDGRRALKKLDALIDRYLLGKQWQKYASSKRTLFFAVPEHSGGELHYHLLLKLPRCAKWDVLRIRFLGSYLKQNVRRKHVFRAGDVDVRRLTGFNEVTDSINRFRTACYVAKRLWDLDSSQQWIVSTEFH